MAMRRCGNGHFYDDGKHSQCPYCGVQGVDLHMVGARNSFAPSHPNGGHSQVTVAKMPEHQEAAPHVSEKKPPIVPKQPVEEGKTVGLMYREKGFDPVVGWLVAVEGPEKGRDYHLKSEKNFVGRSAKMDVAILGDESVSRESHAIISYNPKNNTFKLLPGESRGLVYLNDEEVLAPTEMKDRDIIELGKTKLLFVALCGTDFVW